MSKKKKDFSTKTVAELTKEISDTRVAIDKSRLEMAMKKIKNTNAVKVLRKSLAQLSAAKNIKELAVKS